MKLEPNLLQSSEMVWLFLVSPSLCPYRQTLLVPAEISGESLLLCYYVALTRGRNVGNLAGMLVIQCQGIQIRIQEFKPNPNSEPFEMHCTLKVSDFILPDGSLKCSAAHTWLINKIYLSKEAVRECTIPYCTWPSGVFPAGALGKVYGNENLRSLCIFFLSNINEMFASDPTMGMQNSFVDRGLHKALCSKEAP